MRRLTGLLKATPRNPVQAIEAEIAGLETTKASLLERIPALEAAKAEALTRRRESLIGGAGQASEADAHHAAREAESNLEAVSDALAEVERRLADANERLAATRDQVGRDAVADELERDCQAVDAAAKKAREALAAFVKAKDALAATITPLVAGQADMGWRAPPDRIATILVGNLLAADLPAFKLSTQSDLIDGHWHYGKEIEPKPKHAADPVGAILTGRLHSLAADIRTGAASSDLQRWSGTVHPELVEPESQAA